MLSPPLKGESTGRPDQGRCDHRDPYPATKGVVGTVHGDHSFAAIGDPNAPSIYLARGAARLTFRVISLLFGSTVTSWTAVLRSRTSLRRRDFGLSSWPSIPGGETSTRCLPGMAPSPSFFQLRMKVPSSWMVPEEIARPGSEVGMKVTEPPASSFADWPSSNTTTPRTG